MRNRFLVLVLAASGTAVASSPMAGADATPNGTPDGSVPAEQAVPVELVEDFRLDEEDGDLSVWQKIKRIREYKKRYTEWKLASQELQRRCKELEEEILSLRRSIELLRLNARDFSEILDEQREAWRRIYTEQVAEEGETQEGMIRRRLQSHREDVREIFRGTDAPIGNWRSIPENAELSDGTEGSPPHWWQRFRIWKEKYRIMLETYRSWRGVHQNLDQELEAARKSLNQLRESTGASRNILREQQEAWKRLYEE